MDKNVKNIDKSNKKCVSNVVSNSVTANDISNEIEGLSNSTISENEVKKNVRVSRAKKKDDSISSSIFERTTKTSVNISGSTDSAVQEVNENIKNETQYIYIIREGIYKIRRRCL